MHGYWPSPAKSGLAATSSNAAQQLTAGQLHYQQLIRQHHLAATNQQQLAAANNPLNAYQMPYDQLYKNGYLHALSQQALASVAAANNLMNGANPSASSAANPSASSAAQPSANTLLSSSGSTNNPPHSTSNALPATTTESSTLANSLTSNLTGNLSGNLTSNLTNSLSSFAAVYNAHQQTLNKMATTAAFRTALATSGSAALSSAFQLSNSKKRALSSASPYLDSNEAQQMLNSIIRNSPSSLNSLLCASSRSPSATGSMGHLSGTLSPSVNFFPSALSHLVHSPSLFQQTTRPLGHLPSGRTNSALSQGSGTNTPNSLEALTSLGYSGLLANNHHSAFTPHSTSNLQFHYHNLLMQKMDYNGNSTNGQLTKLSGASPTAQHNLLYKNSTVELSPVSNPNSNSPKSTSSELTGKKSAETQTSADEVVVSSTSLEAQCKSKKTDSESAGTTASSGSSPNHALSSSRSSQHSDSSDIVITNSTKEEPSHQETCCYWEGCGPREFNDHLELVRHVSNEHINKDKKAPHVCRWPECSRKLKPFKANYMLDVHVRCHTGKERFSFGDFDYNGR